MQKAMYIILLGLLVSLSAQAEMLTLISPTVDPNLAPTANGNGALYNTARIRDGHIDGWTIMHGGQHSAIEDLVYQGGTWSQDYAGSSPAPSGSWATNGQNGSWGRLVSDAALGFTAAASSNPEDPTNAILSFYYFQRTSANPMAFDWEIASVSDAQAMAFGVGTLASGQVISDPNSYDGDTSYPNNWQYVEIPVTIPEYSRDIRVRLYCHRASGSAGAQTIIDSIGLQAEGSLTDVSTHIDPLTLSGGAVLLDSHYSASGQHLDGNGGFEDVDPVVENHPSNDPPFRVWMENADTLRDASVDGWEFHCSNANGGIQSNITNDGGNYTSFTPYDGHKGLVLNTGAVIDATSTWPINISGMAAGDPLAVEAYVAARTSGSYEITAVVEIDGQDYPLGSVSGSGAGGFYNRVAIDSTLPAAGSTLYLKLRFRAIGDQIWVDNLFLKSYPVVSISEIDGVASFEVKMKSNPGSTIVAPVQVATPNWWDDDKVTVVPDALTFNTSNWNVPQTVTLTAIDNDEIDGTRTYTIAVGDPNAAPNFMKVTVLDDDYPYILVFDSEGQPDPELKVGEGGIAPGETVDFQIQLTGYPSSDVTVTLDDLGDPDQIGVNMTSLVFTPEEVANGVMKTVTINAINDMDNEAMEHTTTLRLSAATDDVNYQAAVEDADLTVTIVEDECGATDFVHDAMDANNDCVINLLDFAELARRWQDCTLPNDPACSL